MLFAMRITRCAPFARRRTFSSAQSSGFFRASAVDVEAYRKDGFLLIKGLLSQPEVALVKRALEEDKSLVENEIVLNDDFKGQTKLALWSNPGDGTLGMFTRSRRVVGTMEALLGGPVVHYHSKSLMKHPESGGVWNWHQDYGYWYKDFFLLPTMATAYLAIDAQNETLNNGCLRLLRGSNEMGRVDHWSKGDQQGADLERVALAKDRYEEVCVDLEPGDCVIFSALTMHASQGNFSKHRRLAMASCYTLKSNQQYKDPYIPCFELEVVDDDRILESQTACGRPRLTSAADKRMLSPQLGVEKARKADQN
eukprot:TRINITY_DN47197_c0_g1_i1.p1 TRINITY_DN47197_c0_g1~~TRINITY_DN47197_c0_g1_i1.p1  ORF type:complete len:319 (-),score=40.63 TRINITY_DN47197_c0_g1_i1:169-1098(-)